MMNDGSLLMIRHQQYHTRILLKIEIKERVFTVFVLNEKPDAKLSSLTPLTPLTPQFYNLIIFVFSQFLIKIFPLFP